MNRKLLLSVLGVVAVSGSAFAANPIIEVTKATTANPGGGTFNVYTFRINMNGIDTTAAGSAAVDLGVISVGSGTINQVLANYENTDADGNGLGTYTRGPVNFQSEQALANGGNGATGPGAGANYVAAQDTYILNGTANTNPYKTLNPGTNWFGNGVDLNGADDGTSARAGAYSNGVTEGLAPNSYSIALGAGTGVSGLATAPVNILRVVALGDVSYKGGISRNGVQYPVQGDTVVAPAGITLTAGGTATTTIAGNNISYAPTVLQTYATPVTTGTNVFAFAGTNTGSILIALDLNLNGSTLAAALGTLPANLSIYTGTNAPFSSAYDVVLVAAPVGSGPFTFNFTVLNGATVNAVSAVPEPTGLGALAVAALPALARRRRA